MGTGCGGGGDKPQQSEETETPNLRQLEEATMAVHDSIMPQMDSLMELKKALKDSLAKTDQAGKAKVMRAQIDSLDQVREGMMNWMSRYSKGYKRLPDTVARDVKAEKLNKLHQDVEALKKRWDQTLKQSSGLVNKKP